MLRFISYSWNANEESPSIHARRLIEKTDRDSELLALFSGRGFAVYGCGFRRGSIECYRVNNDAGIVLGTLFCTNTVGVSAPVTSLSESGDAEATARELIRRFWGRYVAFLHDRETAAIRVLQDPSAGLSVYRAVVGGVVIHFAELSDCIRLTGARFEIDWEYIAANAMTPILQSRATGLKGVEELLGGDCDEIVAGNVTTRVYWSLSSFATPRIENAREAAVRLRHRVKDSIHAWASLYRKILVRYSGGVDSSILLFCLKDAPSEPELSCVTEYGVGRGFIDERKYARVGVEAVGCRWIEQAVCDSGQFEVFECIDPAPRPQIYLPALFERELIGVAQEVGASVIATGNGGDGEFFERADIRVASDYVRDHGLSGNFWQVMRSTAELTQKGMPHVVAHAMAALWARPKEIDALLRLPRLQKMLTASAREAVLAQPGRYAPIGKNETASLPLCKGIHIRMMSQPMTVRPTLARKNGPEYGHWLASQLVLQECAATPTYVLTKGGRTRSIAKDAFIDDVPTALLERRAKGNPAALVRRIVRNNRAFARKKLEGGRLVAEGVLDADTVKSALNGTATDVDPWEVLCHVSTEVWVERVEELQKTAAAAA